MEKPLGLRTKGSLNETQGRNESVTGPVRIHYDEYILETLQSVFVLEPSVDKLTLFNTHACGDFSEINTSEDNYLGAYVPPQ